MTLKNVKFFTLFIKKKNVKFQLLILSFVFFFFLFFFIDKNVNKEQTAYEEKKIYLLTVVKNSFFL